MSSSSDHLETLRTFCSHLTFQERKSLITLARSQSIPSADSSPILFEKVSPVLNKLVLHPPFINLSEELLPEGELILELLSSPLTTGILIVYALGVELSDSQVSQGKQEAFIKEFCATQTQRRPSEWNWDGLTYRFIDQDDIIHPLFPFRSPLQSFFSKNLSKFRSSIEGRIIRPHYSGRGISTETSARLLDRVRFKHRIRKYGPASSFHFRLKKLDVTSRDVVHHYIRTGEWVYGRTEMKQRWYPSQLLPRTYFSWGGRDIAISSYLRNFFNDVGDCFEPTERHNRVQPDWLKSRSRTREGGYLFYDLTSFTSWFHEQEAFLLSLAKLFRGTSVYLVGPDLSLTNHDMGSLIQGYAEYVNHFPEFVVGRSTEQRGFGDRSWFHQCAGFLGVPGNLVTCTIPHGLALATFYEDPHQLQVPGDDVGAEFWSADHKKDIGTCAQTLGKLQFDKVFSTPEISIYLKRLVLDLGSSIKLAPMLIYPLLPYLINPEGNYRSNQYRLPDPKKARSRAAAVLVTFHRDVWKMTKGDLDDISEEIILLFIRRVHDMTGLPYDAIFQGRLYGSDDEDSIHRFPDIAVKFPVVDSQVLRKDPDRLFAAKYITRMTIRSISDVQLPQSFKSLSASQSLVVNKSKSWSFLEDMGYVKMGGIPGDKIELFGSDARDAYLYSTEPSLREVEVLCDLDTSQLVAAGILPSAEVEVFEGLLKDGSRPIDGNALAWRYRKWVDYDDPDSLVNKVTSRDIDELYADVEERGEESVDLDNLDY